MKHIKLTLSDPDYNEVLKLAGAHAVSAEVYVATEIRELLHKRPQSLYNHPQADFQPETNKTTTPLRLRRVMPDTLEQVLAVCKYVYRSRAVPKDPEDARTEFLDALNAVAKNTINSQTGKLGVEVTTVRDKCTTYRRLGLPGVHIDTPTFVAWLCSPELLRDHLCRKFPQFVDDIHQRFTEWLPGKFQTN